MAEREQNSKLNKTEIIANLLWTAFGIIGRIQ